MSEPILSVRTFVQMLVDAALLPCGFSLQDLLWRTLPRHYLSAPRPLLARTVGGGEGDGDAPSFIGLQTNTDHQVTLSADDLAELMDLKLIYSEFEDVIMAFAELYGAPRLPPWAPPSPASQEAGRELAEAALTDDISADDDSAVLPAFDSTVDSSDAEGVDIIVDAVAALRDEILPRIGGSLLTRLDGLATAAA